METQVIVPCPGSGDGYVELARRRDVTGTPFRKQILTLGTLYHPATGEKLTLDNAFYDRLKSNFDNGVCDIVQVPLADAQNRHSEDPLRNAGEVVALEREGDKIYTVLDIRDPAIATKMKQGTLLGASAYLNLNYKDTRTNQAVGPTLLHTCVTNRPYVLGLEDYTEVIAASVADEEGDVVVLAAQEGSDMPQTKEELIAALKDHGVDVAALEAQVAKAGDMSQLTAALTAALAGTPASVKLTGDQSTEVKLSDVVGAISELAQQNVALTSRVDGLNRQAAESEIDGYIAQGRVLPKQRESMVTLALTNRDMMATLLPDSSVIVGLTPVGTSGTPQGEHQQVTDVDAEIMRLTQEHKEVFERTEGKPGSASRSARPARQ